MKNVQYVVNAAGERTAVQIPLKQYEVWEQLLEDAYLAKAAREALADEERIPWEQVKAEMMADGRLEA